MAYENRYRGYLDDERQPRATQVIGEALKVAGFAVAGVFGARFLIQSPILQSLNDEVAPWLVTRARGIARGEATRRAGESLAEAIERGISEETERFATPRPFIMNVLEQRSALIESMTRAPRQALTLAEVERRFGSRIARGVRQLLESSRRSGLDYFSGLLSGAVTAEAFAQDVGSFIQDPQLARQVYDVLRGFVPREVQDIAQMPFAKKIDEIMVQELARRRSEPSFVQKLLGIRPATVEDLLAQGILQRSGDLGALLEAHPALSRVVADPSMFVTETGRLLDLRNLALFNDLLARAAGHTLPGKIAHIEEIAAARRAPFLYRIYKGRVQPFITGDMTPLEEDALVIGSRMVRMFHPEETLATDVQLLLNTGTVERLARHMVGLEPEPNRLGPNIVGEWAGRLGIRDLLDLGNQDQSAAIDVLRSRFLKFRDERWYGNVFARLFRGGAPAISDLEAVQRFFEENVEGLSDPVLRVIEEALPKELRGISLYSVEDIMDAARRLEPGGLDIRPLRLAMRMGEEINVRGARQRVSREILRRSDLSRIRALIDRAVAEHRLTKAQAQAALDMVNYHLFTLPRDMAAVPGLAKQAAEAYVDLFSGTQPGAVRFQREVADLVRRRAGGWARGLVTVPPYLDAGRYIVMRRPRKLSDALGLTASANESVNLVAWAKQFFAGRRNLEDVTVATLFPYHALERVNRALVPSGLALGPDSLGSVGDILSGLILKRVMPAYLLVQGISYLNWEIGKFTGRTAEERYYRTRAKFALDMATLQDVTGITRLRKGMYRVMPGIEVLGDVPFLGVPFREPRSREELEEFLRYGEEPVRQGRGWLLSNTPWRGGRIQYYRPNWYRMGVSHYKMTDVLYGSAEAYWAHSWLPTPRYPFSPLVALLDPYWLEKKHYLDRPYPVTGPLVSDEIFFGPVINSTIGRIIKPRRRMHQAELRAMNLEEKRKARDKRRAGRERYLVTEAGGELRISSPIVYPAAGAGAAAGGVPGTSGAIGYGVARAGRGGIVYGQGVAPSAARAAGGAAASNAVVRAQAVSSRLGIASSLVEVRAGTVQSPAGQPGMPNTLLYDMGQYGRNVRNLLGIYGWGMELAGFETRPQLVMASAGRMYSMERFWRDMNLGGTILQFDFGLGLNDVAEIARRFLTRRPAAIQEWNPLRNEMPAWMPGSTYFQDFQHGDPYAKVPLGEARLPGEGYEVTHPLYPDVDSELGFFTRFAILSDVAPWSNEWRAYSRIVSARRQELQPELRAQVGRIRKQVSARKRNYDLHPYRFQQRETAGMKGTIAEFIDPSTFTIEELPNTPIRLAGVRLTKEHPISEYLEKGQEVQLVVDADMKRARDTLRTLRATVYVGNRNLNLMLLRAGVAHEKETDWSAAGVEARFTPAARALGGAWERLAHLDIPILHRKFLPVDSPLEFYERRLVYGKEFASWEHPYSDYLGPTFEAYAQKNPVSAGVLGGFTGALLGATLLGGGPVTKYAAVAGAATGSVLSVARGAYELFTGRRWVPERVRRRWEIETYFDVLEYVKYRGIYEYAARRAAREEGVDIKRLYREAERERDRRKRAENQALRLKRRATLQGDQETVKAVNASLKVLRSTPRMAATVGPWGRMAIAARQRYESTLYGADIGNTRDVVRALPATSREFYKYFVEETDPRRRRRILSIVPPLERRIYQKAWGMPVDKLPDLRSYFRTHKLPRPDWAGWRPEVDLNLVRLKVVKNEALDMHDYGFYPMDELRAEFAPGISRPFKPQHYAGGIEKALRSVLQGFGLRDISVESIPVVEPRIDIDFDLMLDRTEEVSDYIEGGEWAS